MGLVKIAIKMLMGDRAKYIGLILALSFASFIITQQAAIFLGLMERTFAYITDTSQPDIWVMDPGVQYIDDVKPMKETMLNRVRGIEGVDWAVPLYKGLINAKKRDGSYESCILIGIDDATLIGGPPRMIQGDLLSLRYPDAVIVNRVGSVDKLCAPNPKNPSEKIPLQVGETLELNDSRTIVTGICEVTRSFQSRPVIYTTYNRATMIVPYERKLLSFILVKGKKGVPPKELCQKIQAVTKQAAYTSYGFKSLTVKYYVVNTGILLNFGVAVLLGFIIGIAIAGQTFFNFINDNLRYLAVMKAVGASTKQLIVMTVAQVTCVGLIGWGFGTGAAALFGYLTRNTDLSFTFPWQLYTASGVAVFLICAVATFVSLRKIFRLETGIVFQS